MEDLGLSRHFGGAYAGRRVLLTGHSGFKGSWLALWLQALGAEVLGLSLDPPSDPHHLALLGLDLPALRLDLRDAPALERAVMDFAPQAVFHLAAQPLVRASYAQPADTFAVNLMGTVNLLQACRRVPGLRAVVVVTSDKCYENREWTWGYRENDPLGGHDPYSASKGCAELATAAYRRSFFHAGAGGHPALVASVRAGNVIGGGDWGADRLVPDLARAAAAGQTALIRHPQAVRPWQHVLDPLAGYLLLAWRLIQGRAELATAFNFGPAGEGNLSVAELAARMAAEWPAVRFAIDPDGQGLHEAASLRLDSSLAAVRLGWRPVWDEAEAVARTAQWHRAWHEQGLVLSAAQLKDYCRRASQLGLIWAAA
ncbi:MAG: CDP-glucose 4,6-dehydratase [Thermodesulfobacteriota bacterium]